MDNISNLSDNNYSIVPIADYSPELTFHSEKAPGLERYYSPELAFHSEKAPGLERYLKKRARVEDMINRARTYLIIDKATKEIAAYFTLKTGLITEPVNFYHSRSRTWTPIDRDTPFDTISAIELTNIAVNDLYRKNHPIKECFMAYLLDQFILPIIDIVQEYIGIERLYLFALPQKRLINYYEYLGFKKVSFGESCYYNQHIRPQYDDHCTFMYAELPFHSSVPY